MAAPGFGAAESASGFGVLGGNAGFGTASLPTGSGGPIGPKPGRKTTKRILWNLQSVLVMELGVLNSLCDIDLEAIPEAQVDKQFQEEILAGFRDRANCYAKRIEDARSNILQTLEQVTAVLEQAYEDDRPELEDFMEEFSDENRLMEHLAAAKKLLSRIHNDVSEHESAEFCSSVHC
ncbi:hypothetical protein AAVH_17987 [Aphelenchoides avenae]|nr:hypothetical protein AAVH_17987 [Aphelenchus avenae]